MNLQPQFVDELLENIKKIGISQRNIIAIFLVGSGLYLDEPNDIDVKVIIKQYNPKAETLRNFEIGGKKIQAHYYRLSDWEKVKDYKVAYFITESEDMVLLYGDDTEFHRFNLTNNIENQRYVLNIYDKHLFNYDESDTKIHFLGEKRVWNFLLFYYKVVKQSNELTANEKEQIGQAHKGLIGIENCRQKFNELKQRLYNQGD